MDSAAAGSGRTPSGASGVRFLLKCKWKGGCTVLPGLSELATFGDLRRAVAAATGLRLNDVLIKTGYPPTPLFAEPDVLMRDLGFASGSTIVVEECIGSAAGKSEAASTVPSARPHRHEGAATTAAAAAARTTVAPNAFREDGGAVAGDRITCRAGELMRKRVPKDNSCFFTSVAFCICEREDSRCQQAAAQLRESVSTVILSGQEAYSEAILGRPPHDYAAWIRDPASWGGGIEAAILAELYCLEIVVVDVETCRPQHFGQQAGYAQRILLLYDGGHYDPLCRGFSDGYDGSSSRGRASADSPALQTVFSTDDNAALYEAIAIAGQARAAGEYVRSDVRKIRLCCCVCRTLCDGPDEANGHANATGHTSFDQVGN